MPILTQSITVPSAGGTTTHPASYSFVKSTAAHVASGVNSINISTSTPGNLLIATAAVVGNLPITGVGGPGTTGWVDGGNGSIFNAAVGDTFAQFVGKVQAAQATTLVFSITGLTTQNTEFIISEFTCPGVTTDTTWTVDKFGNRAQAAVTALLYPTLTLSGVVSPVIYWGSLGINTLTTLVGGGTAGFSYIVPGGLDNAIHTYNPAVTAVATPAATAGASTNSFSYALEAYANNLIPNTQGPVTVDLQPVTTGRQWVISQIGIEFLPANAFTNTKAKILLNGRVVKDNVDPQVGYQGPPWIRVYSGDTMSVVLSNAPVGSSAIVNFFYNEYDASAQPSAIGGIV